MTADSTIPEQFRRLFEADGPLSRFDAMTLERDPAVIYVLDPEGNFLYCNEAWDRFALENGGLGLNRLSMQSESVYGVLPEVLIEFYREHYREVMATGEPWEFSFECTSPDRYRQMHMRTLALDGRRGLLIASAIVVDRQHERGEGVPLPQPGQRIPGIHMCASCRRIRCPESTCQEWVWSRSAVQGAPAGVSHDLCPLCSEHYYGRDVVRSAGKE